MSQIRMDPDPGVRFSVVVCVGFWLAGCQTTPPPTTPERCAPTVPPSAQHPVARRVVTLAGNYDLIQVRTQPKAGTHSVGRLHLAQPDSLARAAAVGGAARDLVGWLEAVEGDTTWRPGAGSRDPEHPGAVLAGNHLRLGQPGSLDAHVEHLTITAVAPEGFWGWWKADPGMEIVTDATSGRVLPDPAGYFCALRAGP